ncbi:hypothetical protein TSMEX_008078 [Taenia solium]|eukprot:TsM_000900800 transcript=TsM_000900800 gene=TsM_000900800
MPQEERKIEDFGSSAAADLLIGLPHVHHEDIDRRLLEERLEFITGDLTVKMCVKVRTEGC